MNLNEILKMDCIEGMKQIGNQTIDLVVTDPPYLMNYQSNMRKEKFDFIHNDRNSHDLISKYFEQCARIMKDGTGIYSFCSWHHFDFFKSEFEKHFKLKNLIIWVKNHHGAGDLEGGYAPQHELILFGHKGRHLLRGKRISDVIHHAKVVPADMVHATEKPVGLIETLIKKSSDKGEIVFDGFMGSGTTAVACLNTDRQYMGFEMDDRYYETCIRRTTVGYSHQMDLFNIDT